MELAEKLVQNAEITVENKNKSREIGKEEETRHHQLTNSNALLSSALLSSRPKKLVGEISLKTQQLLNELSVILIQRIARGYICRRAMKISRLVSIIKEQLGSSFAASVLEEVILQKAFEIATSQMRTATDVEEVARVLEVKTYQIFEGLLKDRLPVEIKSVVELAVEENVQKYLEDRRKKEIQNPLLRIIHDLIDESFLEHARKLVEEVVTEQVDDHLVSMRSRVALDVLLSEIVDTVARVDFDEICEDVDVELSGLSILDESVDEIIDSFVSDIVDEIREDIVEAEKSSERTAIEQSMKDIVIRRFMLTHLMQSISEDFNTVQIDYYARAMLERMVAARLTSLANEIEDTLGGLVKNEILKHIFSKFNHELMQRALIAELQGLSTDLLLKVDEEEEKALAKEYIDAGRSHKLAYVELDFPLNFREIAKVPDESSENGSGSSSTDAGIAINFQS